MLNNDRNAAEDDKVIEVNDPPIAPKVIAREERTRHPIALIVVSAYIALVFMTFLASVALPAQADAIHAMMKDLMVYVTPITMVVLGYYFAKRK